jgi:hypothetical protein
MAQNCVWAKSGDGSSLNESHTVCSDKDGNVFITGIFAAPTITFGGFTLTNNGAQNIFLVKYDPNGNVLWAKSGSSPGNDWAYSVTADKDGNAYITGCFDAATIAFDSYTFTNAGGGYDMYLAKYDPNGNVIWAKREGGANSDAPFSVNTDTVGNVYLTGYSTSTVLTIGNYTLTNPTAYQGAVSAFLIKYNSGGNVLWVKGVSGGANSYAGTVDNNGNSYITGGFDTSMSIGSFTLTQPNSGYGFFIAKFDSMGNVLWAKKENVGFGYALSTNASGDVFVTGDNVSTASLSIGSYSFSNADIFIAKYNSNGNVAWAKGFGTGGGTNNYGYSVATDANYVYTTGRFTNSLVIDSYTLTSPPGSVDPMYLLRFDFNGNLVWATALASGGLGGNNQNGVCTDKTGNIYITSGFKVNPFAIGTNSLTLTGMKNPFVAKYHFSNVSIKENQKENTFELFPNPANDLLYINFTEKQFNSAEIINSNGVTLKKFDLISTNEKAEISVKNLSVGVYILKLNGNNSETFCKKFVVNR